MNIEQIAKRYKITAETVAEMSRDGVLLTDLLTPEQVAERFQTKPDTIYKLVRSGELPARRLKGSRLLRFDPLEIEASPDEQTPSNVFDMRRR